MNDRSPAFRAGDEITRKSFAIIRGRLGEFPVPEKILEIMVRVAHTTGDLEFSKTILFSLGSVEAGMAALRTGRPIVTDVGMVKAGIRAAPIAGLGSRVVCLLDDPASVELAAAEGITRSAAAMRLCTPLLEGAVVAIGNAPTALFELLDLIGKGLARPAIVIGIPVGFVGAAESKEELWRTGYTCITNHGERGGSPIAAAIVNGLAHLATPES